MRFVTIFKVSPCVISSKPRSFPKPLPIKAKTSQKLPKIVKIPGRTPEEIVGFPVHELRSELAHFLFHFPHFGVESLPDITEFGVYHAEVSHFDGNVTVEGHLGPLSITIFNTNHSAHGTSLD